jgi:hypothetical protein
VTIHEAVKHTRPRRLANGGGNSGSGIVGTGIDTHTFIVDEVFLLGNCESNGVEQKRLSS